MIDFFYFTAGMGVFALCCGAGLGLMDYLSNLGDARRREAEAKWLEASANAETRKTDTLKVVTSPPSPAGAGLRRDKEVRR
jgi:hypothetical protein